MPKEIRNQIDQNFFKDVSMLLNLAYYWYKEEIIT